MAPGAKRRLSVFGLAKPDSAQRSENHRASARGCLFCEKLEEKVKKTDCPLCEHYNRCSHITRLTKQSKNKKNPFDYQTPEPIFGFTNPKTREIPLKEYCEKLKESQFRNDEALRLLTDTYRDSIGKQKLFSAESMFLKIAVEMMQGNDPYLTKKHYDILIKAYNGDIGAIQTLIQANPEVLHLITSKYANGILR